MSVPIGTDVMTRLGDTTVKDKQACDAKGYSWEETAAGDVCLAPCQAGYVGDWDALRGATCKKDGTGGGNSGTNSNPIITGNTTTSIYNVAQAQADNQDVFKLGEPPAEAGVLSVGGIVLNQSQVLMVVLAVGLGLFLRR